MIASFAADIIAFKTHALIVTHYFDSVGNDGYGQKQVQSSATYPAIITPAKSDFQRLPEGQQATDFVNIAVAGIVKPGDSVSDGIKNYQIESIQDFTAQGNFMVLIGREV